MKQGGQGCSVFVGNIDFDVPEEKILEELKTVGKVVSFKMVYDRQTGRSKGYGFVEYESQLVAETAVQTLRLSFNGRAVKINYADSDLPPKTRTVETVDLNEIADAVHAMDEINLKNVLLHFKRMAVDQPSKLKEILNGNKNVIVALFEAFLKLKLVDSSVLEELIRNGLKEEKKGVFMKRICSMQEEDLLMYPEEVRNKLIRIKNMNGKKITE